MSEAIATEESESMLLEYVAMSPPAHSIALLKDRLSLFESQMSRILANEASQSRIWNEVTLMLNQQQDSQSEDAQVKLLRTQLQQLELMRQEQLNGQNIDSQERELCQKMEFQEFMSKYSSSDQQDPIDKPSKSTYMFQGVLLLMVSMVLMANWPVMRDLALQILSKLSSS